ncbi:hypothetical protein E5676_scaffold306G00770 [Cucumis melo var. makuwa]|uniref:Uncharacterized protein n=1 Tax=Cucumis melo var. makuwa TaxID=1194695 RepID=A0A5D3D283_CUCMM|nr:hypothetical protein E6C27_scaffold333G00740 [Cucumis melo var. makuwa]TYK17825.1 hypothetical protein E5676_scaffold306G00770 [Cucumis melo var. makuwa]
MVDAGPKIAEVFNCLNNVYNYQATLVRVSRLARVSHLPEPPSAFQSSRLAVSPIFQAGHSQPDCLSVFFGYTKDQFVLGVPLGSSKTIYVPTGSQIARVKGRASSEAEVEVRARASWRLTRSDCGEP